MKDSLEYKAFRLDLKDDGQVDETGRFNGYTAIFGNLDKNGDVIEPGAFTKTLRENGGKVPLLWQHDPTQPIGVATVKQDRKGLAIDGQLNMEVQRAREARALMRQGALGGLSIGYVPVVREFRGKARHLKEVALMESSPVTFPANPLAKIGAVKAALLGADSDRLFELIEQLGGLEIAETTNELDTPDEKGARRPARFTFAPQDHEWDASAAEQRWRAYTKASKSPNPSYASGFLWSAPGNDDDGDGVPDNFGDYKLLIVDVIDGEPHIVPRAVYAVAQVLAGGRALKVSTGDKDALKSSVNGLYAKMREQFKNPRIRSPFESSKDSFLDMLDMEHKATWSIELISDTIEEIKVGRAISAATEDKIRAAIKLLQALLPNGKAEDFGSLDGAAAGVVEPEELSTLRDDLKAELDGGLAALTARQVGRSLG